MVTVIHGENTVASRKVLTEKIKLFQERGGEIVRIDGRKVDLTEIKQACESGSLFGNNRLVVIEDFLNRPKSNQKTEIENYFKNLLPQINIILWEEKQLTPSQVSKLSSWSKVYLFKIEPIIFKFLDSLRPGNIRLMLSLLKRCCQVESAEMIFYMICRQIRILILANDLGKRGLVGMPFWMQNKFFYQSRNFSLEKLLDIHRQLVRIDYEQKTGRAIMPLDFYLDLLVANL